MHPTVNTVAFILIKDNKVLVERRRHDKPTDPDKVVIPGGHIEPGETHIQACKRELKEELDIDCNEFTFYAKMLCETETELQMNHWYICHNWTGTPNPTEAEEIFYINRDEINRLDLPTTDK